MSDPRVPLGRIHLAKVVLALVGVAVFGYGIRVGSTATRWVGIAVVGVGWALRFFERSPQSPDDTR